MAKQGRPSNISPLQKYLVAATLLGAFSLLGCQKNEDPRNIHIEGSITLNGKLIEAGKISFTPDSQAGNKGPMGVCKIKDGKYSTDSLGGRGVVGGHHIVEIEDFSDSSANVEEVVDSSGSNEGGIDANSEQLPKAQAPQAYFEDWDIPVDDLLIHRDFNLGK